MTDVKGIHMFYRSPSTEIPHAQRGFSLIEVSIVTAIILLVAIIGIPAIGSYVIENRVPKVGEELLRFIARTKVNSQGAGASPYSDLHLGVLANALRGSSVITVQGSGSGAVIAHGLGGSGVSGNGTIAISPVAVPGAGAGSGFSVTLVNVNAAACPALASILQRVSEIISVQGERGAVVVKNSLESPALPYRAALAQAQCSAGDSNTFVFTAR